MAIIDKAHTLEAVAGEHLGLKLSSIGVDLTLARLYNERSQKGLLAHHKLGEAIRIARNARTAADDFFDRIEDWYERQPTGFNGRVRAPIECPDILPEALRKLATAIGDGASTVEPVTQRIELNAAELRCRALAEDIADWTGQKAADSVYWIELENKTRRRVRLAAAPLDVAPSLRAQLFERVPTCILTSATLCVGSPPKFDFIRSRIGLAKGESLALGSPFDFASQVTVHLPSNLPDPAEEPQSFERGAIRAIAHYLQQTHGKAFVLFTSYKMLEAAAHCSLPGWRVEKSPCSRKPTACRARKWSRRSRPTSTASSSVPTASGRAWMCPAMRSRT